MEVKIRVTYRKNKEVEKKIDAGVDEKINKLIKGIGGVWYAQGVSLESGIRDICFDIEI